MEKSSKNIIIIFVCAVLLFTILFLRITLLTKNNFLKTKSETQTEYKVNLYKTRGKIYDCKMNKLTDTKLEYYAICLPTNENINDIKNSLYFEVTEKTKIEINKPIILKVKIKNPEIINIKNVTVFCKEIRTEDKEPAEHLIGYTDKDGNGVTGLEKAYNDYLKDSGNTATVVYKTDAMRRILKGVEPEFNLSEPDLNGIVLTIDLRLQKIIEKVGEKQIERGAVVLMDAKTGELKAVASFPEYNLKDIKTEVKAENSPMLNRAFSDYAVGSAFKVVTMSAALKAGVSENLTYTCTGKINIDGNDFSCHKLDGHGTLDMKQGLAVSCNPYFINLSLKLLPDAFLNMAKDMGFSKPIEFSADFKTSSGNLPTVEELSDNRTKANFAFGQGILLANPIQLAKMLTPIVNEGNVIEPTLVKGYTDNGKTITALSSNKSVVKAMNKDVAETVKKDLIYTSEQKLKPKYVKVAGKTATAQTGQFSDNKELYNGWYVGFFPAENPKYIMVVLSENATSGTADCIPIFNKIADEIYKPTYYTEN